MNGKRIALAFIAVGIFGLANVAHAAASKCASGVTTCTNFGGTKYYGFVVVPSADSVVPIDTDSNPSPDVMVANNKSVDPITMSSADFDTANSNCFVANLPATATYTWMPVRIHSSNNSKDTRGPDAFYFKGTGSTVPDPSDKFCVIENIEGSNTTPCQITLNNGQVLNAYKACMADLK
jgi:hypothetical protein